MKLGFSTGTLLKLGVKAVSKQVIDVIRETGGTAIEFHIPKQADILALKTITKKNLDGFSHVSIHLPKTEYKNNQKTRAMLDSVYGHCKRLGMRAMVIHPDLVSDWSVFNKYSIVLAVENMDKNKNFGANVDDLNRVFGAIDARMVLDLNHCYTLDPSMRLARDFYKQFKDRITHLHISGYREDHVPLFETKQDGIISAIPDRTLPMIIEGVFSKQKEMQKEFNYITSHTL